MLPSIIVMATNRLLKTETGQMDRNPLITTHKRDLWTILRKSSLFPEASTIIFAATKNETVGRVLNSGS